MSMLSSSLKNLFSRPFTTRYPETPAELPPGNRGRVLYDMEKCIFCRKCERSCPTNAITTDKDAKTQTVVRHRCIACNTCVEVCPTQTISMAPEYSKPDTAPTVHVFSVDLPRHQYRVEHLPRREGRKQ
jgi:ech hydrogenase subunit F